MEKKINLMIRQRLDGLKEGRRRKIPENKSVSLIPENKDKRER